jgi:hypothetical protein
MATDGSLGRRIFSNDNASDLREDYRKLIGDGVSGVEATDRLIQEWAPDGDPDFEPCSGWRQPSRNGIAAGSKIASNSGPSRRFLMAQA